LVQKTQAEPQVFYGMLNRGTSQVAEVLAYLQPLEYLNSLEQTRRDKHGARPRALKVHIVTDSEYVKNTGNGSHNVRRNAGLWATFDVFSRLGLVLFWHWKRRDTTALNAYTDALSRDARLLIQKARLKQKLELKRGPAAAHNPLADGPPGDIPDDYIAEVL
jgi:ribonuclease HI